MVWEENHTDRCCLEDGTGKPPTKLQVPTDKFRESLVFNWGN